ncbi:MAG: hypothetical protein PUF29_04805 [Anaerobutyricum hallii]|uniref:hypothetical protein n=1 Tax=Anaerobutyricum hallii TaxID=39488 RepID=UPI00242AE01D|nr:hypothetical protein [Anaerobutyricum hallii]MDD6587927.1 hypothetical protein [Anaerobutyricum hallii]
MNNSQSFYNFLKGVYDTLSDSLKGMYGSFKEMYGSLKGVYDSWKWKTVDSLIARCGEYVMKFCSESEAKRFAEAYKESRYDEVKDILEKTREAIKNKRKTSKNKINERELKNELFDTNIDESSSSNNDGKEDIDKMDSNSTIIIAVIVIAILVINVLIYLKRRNKNADFKNKSVDEVLSKRPKKDNSIKYTDEDKDLMKLIHELSEIYDNRNNTD